MDYTLIKKIGPYWRFVENLLVLFSQPILYGKTNLPTKKAKARKGARLPRAFKNERRKEDHPTPPPRRTRKAYSLISVFPRSQRLAREDFPTALQGGRRLSSPHLTLVVPRNESGYAVVISKKTEKSAVRRHAIKRRVFAALKPLPLPRSLVVLPKKNGLTLSTQELRADIERLLSKKRD